MKTQNRITMATVLTLCLLISGFVTGQSYQFKPEWKEGETKTMIKHQVFKKYEQGELIQEDEQTLDYPQVIEVLKNTPEYLEVVLKTDMAEFEEIFVLLEKMNEEIDFPEQLQINYRINKENAELEVLNKSELFTSYNNKIDTLKNQNEQQFMMIKTLFGGVFDSFISLFASETAFEKALTDKIDPLIIPYKNTYQPGDTLITEEVIDNPLVPEEKIVTTVSTTFDSSGEDHHVYQITNNYNIDPKVIKDALINMMKSMMESFGADAETVEENIKPLREAEISYHIHQTIFFDSQTNWVKSIITTYRNSMVDPQTGNPYETEMIETISVK